MMCHQTFQGLGRPNTIVLRSLLLPVLTKLLLRIVMVLLLPALLAGCVATSNTATSSIAADQHLGAGGVAQQSGTNNPRTQSASFVATGDSAYKIGTFDVLDISVFEVPELTKTVQVADTGTINLPLVGEVQVAVPTEA